MFYRTKLLSKSTYHLLRNNYKSYSQGICLNPVKKLLICINSQKKNFCVDKKQVYTQCYQHHFT